MGDVEGIAVSDSGKLFLYGTFTSYNGVDLPGMALLNEDGTLDNSFDPGAGVSGSQFTSPIQMAEFAANGDIFIGGNFTTYKGEAVNYLFRVNADGSLDTGFAPGVFASNFSQVIAMLTLSDGSFLVRGSFTQFNGVSQTYVVCLDDTGAKVDHSVGTGVNGSISDWQLEADGSIIMVGSFFSPKNRMMRINPTPPVLEIVAEPEPFSIESGQYGRFKVAAVGQGPLSFRATTDDPDGDGIPNAAEYAFGTNPLVADQVGAPEPEFLTGTELGLGNNDLYLTLTIRVKRDVPGVSVTPRASMNLLTLNTGAANVVLMSGPLADGEFDIYQYRSAFSVNEGNPQGFMDVVIATF